MTPDIAHFSAVDRKLSQATRRIRVLLVSHWCARSVCWIALICTVWLAAAKVKWLPAPSAIAVAAILGAAAAAGAVIGCTRRLTRRDVAVLTDERTELKDRLATAVQFERSAAANPFAQMQLADAGARAQELDLRRAFPARVTREMIAAVVLGVFLFASFLIPTMPIFWSKEKRQEVADVKRWAVEIEKPIRIAQKTAEQQKLDSTAKAANEAARLAEAMKHQNMPMKAAMVNMAKLTKPMEEQLRRMAQANEASRQQMQKASADIKRALSEQKKQVEKAAMARAAEAKKNRDKGAEPKPGDKAAQRESQRQAEEQAKNAMSMKQSPAMQQAQQELQKFAQALADQNFQAQNEAMQQLADQMEQGQLSQDERQSLQQQLQQMAAALQGTKLDNVSKQLQQAAQMMRQIKLDPETLKNLAKLMRGAGMMCKGAGQQQLDAETLAELLEALKHAKELRMAMGSGGGIPIPIPGMGGGRGTGINGGGHPSSPLKGEKSSTPKLVAVGKNGALTADARASKEFLKYAAMGHKDPRFLPNSKVQGVRNKNVTELQQNFTGNPDGHYQAGTPQYQANQYNGRSQESPVDKENIPAAMRKQVKDYFESINPNR